MKTVYLDIAGRMHSLYRGMTTHPPSGYRVVTKATGWDRLSQNLSRMDTVYSFQEKALGRVIPVNLAKSYVEMFKHPPRGTALTYSAGHLVFRSEPWVVDMEFVTQLAGYSLGHFKRYRWLIQKRLAAEDCKAVICWTEAAKRTITENMDCDGFRDKIEVVPLAVPPKDFVKDYGQKQGVKLLFVGSANIPGEFEYKGGKELLEAFAILRKSYPDIELMVRSDMPHYLKARYGVFENLKIIDGIIPWEELEAEFKSADIFLLPTHSTPGLAFLDAMSYELPIITTDVWANPEMVEDGKTGLLVERSKQVRYYHEGFIPAWSYHPESPFMKSIHRTDPEVVRQIVNKTGLLIEDADLRRRMGQAGRQRIESGRFSLAARNRSLKRIFDKAIGG